MARLSHAIILALAVSVRAQSSQGAFSQVLLCNQTFEDANATGIYSLNPHVGQGTQQDQPDNDTGETLNLDIAVTVAEQRNTSDLQWSIWMNPRGANYTDDFGLGYDVCAMNLEYLPYNTQLRSQTDNGSCVQMFDESCVDALTAAAQDYALQLTLNPTPAPNSNLTWSSLPTVCRDIQDSINSNMPKECSKYLNGSTVMGNSIALTGYNYSIITGTDCAINRTTTDANSTSSYDAFYWVIDADTHYSSAMYAEYVQSVSPILAIWMPIANVARSGFIGYSKAKMACVRAANITEGSEVPVALPAPSPVGGNGGLSGGAIAGIVIGVVVGVGIIIAGLVWFYLRKRRAQKSKSIGEKDVASLSEGGSHGREVSEILLPQEVPNTIVAELPPENVLGSRGQELGAGKEHQVFELPPTELGKGKHNVFGAPAELEGNMPEHSARETTS